MTPPTSWSQSMEQTPGYGATTSSGGVTTPSTSFGGMSGLVPPPPGISIWDPFQWKASVPEASHNPAVQTSRWEGRTAEGRYEQEGSGATGSSDGPSHPSATSTLPESTSNPWFSRRLRLQDWESPLTPQPPSLPPLTVGTLMYAGDRLPEAEMMAVSLPAIPEEDEKGPPSGRPIS